jgi:hypothetical protein
MEILGTWIYQGHGRVATWRTDQERLEYNVTRWASDAPTLKRYIISHTIINSRHTVLPLHLQRKLLVKALMNAVIEAHAP